MDFLSYLGDEFIIIRDWALLHFFDSWGRLLYPDSWVDESRWGYLIAVFIIGVLSILGIIFSTKRKKVWLPLGLSIVTVWTLPVLILWTIELIACIVILIVCIVIGIVGLAIVLLSWWLIFKAIEAWAESEPSEEGDTGEEYIINKENGKEVVYKTGFFIDTKVGELHENWDGSKETNSVFGPKIKVDKSDIFSEERKGEVEGREGVFKKGFTDKHPTFKPDKRK
jgi:hypothetical protein